MPSAVAARRKRLMPLNRIRSQETRVQRFAKNILQIIGEDTIAEKLIRAALGNSPDTSKALRLLLTQKRVLRYGNGGRGSPFMYSVTSEGRKELELIGQV
ncbi:hypothetical protein O6H91_04G007800 [Diphasiastrum complanatum]|uniref:Uncharacterized protein n=1 Tax=Diphasiastrum complanatum TaxID=34168 RepID=A0ACC2DUD5_DIPCM|nr:hypothetical protein O6H91_04G007800 [Diphasiastrum complanatum]